jgi:hypothetical protein
MKRRKVSKKVNSFDILVGSLSLFGIIIEVIGLILFFLSSPFFTWGIFVDFYFLIFFSYTFYKTLIKKEELRTVEKVLFVISFLFFILIFISGLISGIIEGTLK